MIENLPYVSYSRMYTFYQCGIMYYNRYHEKLYPPPSLSMVRGSAGHNGIEHALRYRVRQGVLPPIKSVLDEFNEAWLARVDEIQLTPSELKGGSEVEVKEACRVSTEKMLEAIYIHQIPLCEPRDEQAIESSITVDLDGIEVPLLVKIDLIESDGSISDWKFKNKSPSAGAVDNDFQLSVYDLAYFVAYGESPSALRHRYVVDLKKGPKVGIDETCERNDDTRRRVYLRVADFVQAIKSGDFKPAPLGAWWCTEASCHYWGLCNYRP
jgi:hypothetical protein